MTKVKLIDDVGNFYSFISEFFYTFRIFWYSGNKINGLLESRCQQLF